MKKYFLLFLILFVTGCAREGSFKLYNVMTINERGKVLIKENNIKYLCRDVWDLIGADISRSDCEYIADVKGDGKSITFSALKLGVEKKYEFKPVFTFWQEKGVWFAVPVVFLIFLVMILSS